MPPFLLPYEPKMRNIVRGFFQRGKIDIYISFTEEAKVHFGINTAFAEAIINTMKTLKERHNLDAPLGLDYLYWFKDFVFQQELDFEEEDLYEVLKEALTKLKQMRTEEGKNMMEFLNKGIEEVSEIVSKITSSLEPVEARYERLKKKIQALELELDEQRLYQEAAILADRADVTEELQRLQSHIKEFVLTLKSNGQAIGKKLDFILQECLREFNTLQAKSTSTDVIHLAISGKNEIEKLREQVQNVQ
ncbi:MAG: YicC family protein, partial [Nitrospirae bacterium]